MSQLPIVGPMAGAKVAVRPKKVMPSACCDFGRRVRMMVTAVGIRTPPVNHCPARKTISWPSDVESAQAMEKATKRLVLTER